MSTKSELRDVLAAAVGSVWGGSSDLPGHRYEADAILATPEMQAIRRALRVDAALHAVENGTTKDVWLRSVVMLPASVVEWVLAEEAGDE